MAPAPHSMIILLSVFLAHASIPVGAPTQTAGGDGATGSQAARAVDPIRANLRLVRSVSGSRSIREGEELYIQDPRTVFYLPDDTKVLAYFEWEGTPGVHHLEGVWKNPEGKVVALSDFKYDAKEPRFAAFWTLLLSAEAPTGLWRVEARVDGALAGTHEFQVIGAPRPTDVMAARRALAPSELYARMLAAAVFIEKLGADGERISTASGCRIGGGLVLTTFQAVDGASSLRVISNDGKQHALDSIELWDRVHDWALLRTPDAAEPFLQLARAGSRVIPGRGYALSVTQVPNRVIVSGNIIGRSTFPVVGDRLNVSMTVSRESSGSPIVNDYGEVEGILCPGFGLLGVDSLDVLGPAYPTHLLTQGGPRADISLATPVDSAAFPALPSSGTPLRHLAAMGLLTPPLTVTQDLERGTIATGLEMFGNYPNPVGEAVEYSQKLHKQLVVLLVFNPKEKRRGELNWQLFDVSSRRIRTGLPTKLNLSRGSKKSATWNIDIQSMPPGPYRLDVQYGGATIWRTYFRVNP